MNLYLMHYNNYYNRTIYKEETVDDYYNNSLYFISKENINFNPNNGVTTELTINWEYTWMPDYAIVVDPFDNKKITRWFIIGHTRTRGQQYKMTFRRDLVADYYNSVINADCFIEKATVEFNNPLIYNSENMTVNQIKTKEWSLRDKTNCAWICGYFSDIPKNYDPNSTAFADNIIMNATVGEELNYDYVVNSSFNNWAYKRGATYADAITCYSSANSTISYSGKTAVYTLLYKANDSLASKRVFGTRDDAKDYLKEVLKDHVGVNKINTSVTNTTLDPSAYPIADDMYELFEGNIDSIISTLQSYDTFEPTSTIYNNLEILNNKRVKFVSTNGSVEYRTIKLTYTRLDDVYIAVYNTSNSLWEVLSDTFSTVYNNATSANTPFYIKLVKYKIAVNTTLESSGNYHVAIHSNKQKLKDAPYRMFCIPYSVDSKFISIDNGDSNIKQNNDISMAIAMELGRKYSGANQIYDIQLLPYCPIFNIQMADGSINLQENENQYDVIVKEEVNDGTTTSTTVGFILYPEYSSFTTTILFNEYRLENTKLANETEMFRLVSPNYNGTFEFNPAKNEGLSSFNVDCTYLPYQPYIHINPDFGGLYGKDFDDARGLVCGGDFSLTIMNDAWQTYQIQNKNYQNIFDREIKNMEVQRKYEKRSDIANALAGTAVGATSGALAGSVAGPYGAAAGAIVGGATSLAGGIMDIQAKSALYSEALDYKSDMFGYQLGNIKALPISISRTTAFTYNNKIFPILEYYTCTDEEKLAVANKIALNGMTVMAIGKIKDYMYNHWQVRIGNEEINSRNYIKGSLIKLTNINEDFTVLNELSDEVYKGVYLL